jgi:hypothetical protein
MPTPSVPDGYGRASHIFTSDNADHTCVLTYHFLDDGVVNLDSLSNGLSGQWVSAFDLSELDNGWNVGAVNVLVNRGGAELTGSYPTMQNGTAAVEPEPIGICVCLRKRTGFVGRAYRGRVFLPAGYLGVLAVDDDGTIDANRRDDLTAFWSDFIDNLTSAGYPMYLVSADLSRKTLVTSGDCAPKVSFLRRRNRA